MDLLRIFAGHQQAASSAIADFKRGARASEVAEEHITPIIAELQENAGMDLDPLYVAYLIEHVVLNSGHGNPNPL